MRNSKDWFSVDRLTDIEQRWAGFVADNVWEKETHEDIKWLIQEVQQLREAP